MDKYAGYYQTEVGLVEVISSDTGIVSVGFVTNKKKSESKTAILEKALKQLEEYFKGKRTKFDLKLELVGTEFQRKVWDELQKIPYGTTTTYGELAKKIGNEKAARAVGMANNKNPIGIIIPCHRVIGANGNLTGYAGGLDKKEYLLNLEKSHI